MTNFDQPKLLKAFLHIYFYELEIRLNQNIDELSTLGFQSEEANTDHDLKIYIQKFILTKLVSLPNEQKIKKLALDDPSSNEVFNHVDFEKFKIQQVYLPNQLPEKARTQLQQAKSGVFTNPDLTLEIFDGADMHLVTVELKSTKQDSIPGSSIQQVKPFEWVIFVKHSKTTEVVTGQYINAITKTMHFPDRSPRPQVGFKNLLSWNAAHRTVKNEVLHYNIDPDELKVKSELLQDWQETLAKRWIEVLKCDIPKNSEPWFNNTLRKFAIRYLTEIEASESIDLKKQKDRLSRLIK